MLYRSLLRPALFRLPSETAHEIGLHAMAAGLGTNLTRNLAARIYRREPFGELRRFGLSFPNPVGLAAGFDKNGVATRAAEALGFGFVEVGTVTDLPQPGNPRPRLFRLPLDRALINRAGFNNAGAAALAAKLRRDRPRGGGDGGGTIVGVNIGKSRAVPVEEAVPDYLASFEKIYDVADYVAVNVSSPNTPNLRQLQHGRELRELLDVLQRRNRELAQAKAHRPRPLLLKIAPDLTLPEIESIVEAALGAELSGVIATNTTVARDGLKTDGAAVTRCGAGGLSGAPLRQRSTEVVAHLHRLVKGRLTIIGVGGIFTAADAWEKICAGASLVQIYTGFVYQGPGVARDINDGLLELMRRDGFADFESAVGSRASSDRPSN